MKIINAIQFGKCVHACKDCAWFQNDPLLVEETYRGLTAMSSGFASVRDKDGFCNHHQIYLSARDSCVNFEQRVSEADVRFDI